MCWAWVSRTKVEGEGHGASPPCVQMGLLLFVWFIKVSFHPSIRPSLRPSSLYQCIQSSLYASRPPSIHPPMYLFLYSTINSPPF